MGYPPLRKPSYRISFPGAVPVFYDGRRDLAPDAAIGIQMGRRTDVLEWPGR
jgi:hypothetical protein